MYKYFKNIEAPHIWIFLIASLTYNVLYFTSSSSYIVPVPEGLSDEMDYFTDAKSFYLTNSLHTTVVLNGSVSRVGECSPHGFAYTLLYGTTQKLLNGSHLALIFANLTALLLSLCYLYIQRYSFFAKNSIAALVLSYFMTITFLQTYMSEILNISFILILSLGLYKLYNSSDEKERKRNGWIFFTCVLIFSTFRFTHVYFLLGLIPLANSKKNVFRYAGMILLGFTYVMIIVNLFAANLFHITHSSIHLLLQGGDGNIIAAYQSIQENLLSYFNCHVSEPKFIFHYKYILVLLPLLQIYFFARSNNEIYLAPFIVSAPYLATIWLLYTNEGDMSTLRHLSEVFIINTVFFTMQNKNAINYALLMLALISVPEINNEVTDAAAKRYEYYQYFSKNESGGKYNFIKKFKSDKPIITVQLPSYRTYNDLYFMPLVSDEGKPIRYNLAYLRPVSESSTFVTHYFKETDPQ